MGAKKRPQSPTALAALLRQSAYDSRRSRLVAWMLPLRLCWLLVGFAPPTSGPLRPLEALYFWLLLASSLSCVYAAQLRLAQLQPGLYDARLVIFAAVTRWHQFYPLASLVVYRCADVPALVSFADELCAQLALGPADYAWLLCVGAGLFAQFCAIVYAVTVYFNSFNGMVVEPMHFYCDLEGACAIGFPALQFVWWLLLMRLLVVRAQQALVTGAAGAHLQVANGVFARWTQRRVRSLVGAFKDVFEMKRRVLRIYGPFVFAFPVAWLTGLLFTFSLLSNQVAGLHVALLLAHTVVSLCQFYLPFWASQMTIISMKRSLYSIRKLIVKNQPQFADKQVCKKLPSGTEN